MVVSQVDFESKGVQQKGIVLHFYRGESKQKFTLTQNMCQGKIRVIDRTKGIIKFFKIILNNDGLYALNYGDTKSFYDYINTNEEQNIVIDFDINNFCPVTKELYQFVFFRFTSKYGY